MITFDTIIDKLKSLNIDAYEIIGKRTSKNSITVKNGRSEDFKSSSESVYSVRLLKDSKVGFTYFTDNSEHFDKLLIDALNYSNFVSPDPLHSFYNNEFKYLDIDNSIPNLYDDNISSLTTQKKFEIACMIEERALKYDKRIQNVKDSGCFNGEIEVSYLNSNNISKNYKTNYCGAGVTTVAKDNESSMVGYENFISKKCINIDNINFLSDNAGYKAVRMLNPHKAKSLKCPVIIENELVGEILTIIAPSFYAENIEKSKSMFFKSKIGDKIAANKITLIDDASDVRYISSAPFDDEGTPTSPKYLIKSGELNSFLYNLYYSKKHKTNYSGNAFYTSFKTLPITTYSNFILKEGNDDLKQSIKSLHKGILLTNIMGLHLADTISGEFSLGGEGIMIENGELTYPIKEFVVSGSIKDILKNCVSVFNDTKVNGSVVSPSIMVDGLGISGN